MNIYDVNNNCVDCSEYIYDPHSPSCEYYNLCGLCDCDWSDVSTSRQLHSQLSDVVLQGLEA